MNNTIYIVGIGPGKKDYLTVQASEVLSRVDVIAGYTVYIDIIKENYAGKEFISTPMKQELERCRICFEKVLEGKSVALICSGDAGVYGMASPMFEIQKQNKAYEKVELVVVPGISAALSGAAILGAPINHDFCVISLSDLLTPWELIEKRLIAAVQGDFAVVIYNPSSHKRKDYLSRACQILLQNGALSDRACGYVENIGRENTKATVCTLKELEKTEVNMFTTVFIGNSRTEIYKTVEGTKKLITKRGYSL